MVLTYGVGEGKLTTYAGTKVILDDLIFSNAQFKDAQFSPQRGSSNHRMT